MTSVNGSILFNMPQFTPNFGAGQFGQFGQFDNFTPTFGFNLNGGSSSSKKVESYDEMVERERKEAEERTKKLNEIYIKKAKLQKMITPEGLRQSMIDEAIQSGMSKADAEATVDAQMQEQGITPDQTKAIKNAKKQEDGTYKAQETIGDYVKRTPWWKRALNAAGNMLTGTMKGMAEFIGYKDGKMDWGKCAKNVGLALGCLALTAIPGVGPIIGTSLMVAGLGAGAYCAGKGLYHVATLPDNTPVEELDNAWQDVGLGTAMIVSSRAGLKKSFAGFGEGFAAGDGILGSLSAGLKASNVGKNSIAGFNSIKSEGFLTATGKSYATLGNTIKHGVTQKVTNTRTNINNKWTSIRNLNWKSPKTYLKATYKAPMKALKYGFKGMMLPFKPYEIANKHGLAVAYNAELAFSNLESEGNLFELPKMLGWDTGVCGYSEILSESDYHNKLAQITNQEKTIQEELAKCDKELNDLRQVYA